MWLLRSKMVLLTTKASMKSFLLQKSCLFYKIFSTKSGIQVWPCEFSLEQDLGNWNMAAVHFTAIPCEQAKGTLKAIFWGKFFPALTILCMNVFLCFFFILLWALGFLCAKNLRLMFYSKWPHMSFCLCTIVLVQETPCLTAAPALVLANVKSTWSHYNRHPLDHNSGSK